MKFYPKTITLFFMLWGGLALTINAQVQFNIRGIPGTSTYMVSMLPSQTWVGGLSITNSIQVSIRVPHGTGADAFNVANLAGIVQSSGSPTAWTINGRALAAIDASGYGVNGEYDYYDFGLLTGSPELPYVSGVEVNLFSFDNTGNCITDASSGLLVTIVDNDTDPMVLGGNTYSVNTGNEISPLGALVAGTLNAFTGSYAQGNADCSMNFPVEWLFFNAIPNGSAVDLEWATASENGNQFFSIERSVDASFFEEILRTEAVGNSSTTTTYRNTDPNPTPGFSYYRLRQIDIDGGFTYSEVVEVFFNPNAILLGLNAYPNPVVEGDPYTLQFDTKEAMRLQLELYAPNGQLIANRQVQSKTGKNQVRLSSMNLSAGLYHARLYNETYSESIKIMVQ